MLQGLNHGYAVVAVNYRLSNEAKFPAAIKDVKAAVLFIRVNAAQYNLNPNKIALWGDSAGGNLASLAGTTGSTENCYNVSLGNANVSDNVTAVVDWYGPTNLCVMDEQNNVSAFVKKWGLLKPITRIILFHRNIWAKTSQKYLTYVNRQTLQLI